MAVARYLHSQPSPRTGIVKSIKDAHNEFTLLQETRPVKTTDPIFSLLEKASQTELWLVTQDGYPKGHLVGVLSAFELM
jgi:hypothetical protein